MPTIGGAFSWGVSSNPVCPIAALVASLVTIAAGNPHSVGLLISQCFHHPDKSFPLLLGRFRSLSFLSSWSSVLLVFDCVSHVFTKFPFLVQLHVQELAHCDAWKTPYK